MGKLFKALISVALVSLILASIAYAYETVWSGKATITIEPSSGTAGQLSVEDVAASRGDWEDTDNTWTVAVPRGSTQTLYVTVVNTGGDSVTFFTNVDNINPAPGVTVMSLSTHEGWSTTGQVCPPGENTTVPFVIETTYGADLGTAGEVQFMIGK